MSPRSLDPFDWVKGPYALAIMPHPRGGAALDEDIARLRARGVDVLVSLMEPEEAAGVGLAAEAETCARHGIEFSSYPVPDHHTPSSAADAMAFAARLVPRLRAGEGIVLHCYAGLGRSATMALVTLRLLGLSLHDAVARLSEARGLAVPESREQLRWVAALPIDDAPEP